MRIHQVKLHDRTVITELKSENVTWNDRWETKLFLGGQGIVHWNGSEMNNLNQVQSS